MAKKKTVSVKPATLARPPIVAVVGHVDHGKTTLLDAIRRTNVAQGEHGGITQHIGAYTVDTGGKSGIGDKITFIDTPGHEAFIKMRSRGASVADIAVLVVAADDSVMPQTKESVEQVNRAGIPMIVAVNKVDLDSANPDKVIKDLARIGVQVEGYGGQVPVAKVSALKNTGISELLDLILLVAGLNNLTAENDVPLQAVVIETRMDKGKGMLASVIVRKGRLKNGDPLYDGATGIGKVRALYDENGNRIDVAGVSQPVEIMGFTSYPQVGSVIRTHPVEMTQTAPEKAKTEPDALPDFLKPLDESQNAKRLNVVVKADTAGTLEAVLGSLSDRIRIVGSGIGTVNEKDVFLAKSTGSFVIGFNVRTSADVARLAQTEKVVIRNYSVIYELIEELREVVEGITEILTHERELGQGVIIAEFPFDNARIAGTKVTQERLARGDAVRIMRGDAEVGNAKIKTMRHGKDEVSKAERGSECGILFDRKVDFQVNDVIIAVTQA
ncbi:translation initiation factor IF-2 [Candidatus Gottesmanbacteria bacterium RBG_16_52_11]|uniref:Translation initiation factor IF-2 n=1 Tax=Candidatus Gottesmanbacteria bacterium RBG_16_52_11 TaxID=1798374 RepID=A0A1F5YMG2_9BACT|nr:MAG: translation initiation factor IF-2 [Candidatus Gottesmanbacteria bacterium RBG_16_52_11]